MLCYLLGWITGIVFIIVEKENQFVRFHAFQSIIVFGAITVVDIIVAFIPFIGLALYLIIGVLALILWIMLMLKAYGGQKYKLPWVGDIADKQSKPTP